MAYEGWTKPKFAIFDYGETLAHEADFDPRAGFAAMLPHAARNPQGIDADSLFAEFQDCFREMRLRAHAIGAELPNRARWRWLFDYYDLEFDLTGDELETVFWDAAAPCSPTPGIRELLSLLRASGIGTGVVSNMGFAGSVLRHRLARLFPEHSFQFVLSSADYVMRKPNPRLFQLALKKAGCRAEETWFLGDTLCADIAGADAAGLTAVYYDRDLGCVYRENPPVDPMPRCIRVTDWADLYPFFRGE